MSNNEEKIKPCPFCGGEMRIIHSSYLGDYWLGHKDKEKADNCIIRPICISKRKGKGANQAYITAWNKRV